LATILRTKRFRNSQTFEDNVNKTAKALKFLNRIICSRLPEFGYIFDPPLLYIRKHESENVLKM